MLLTDPPVEAADVWAVLYVCVAALVCAVLTFVVAEAFGASTAAGAVYDCCERTSLADFSFVLTLTSELTSCVVLGVEACAPTAWYSHDHVLPSDVKVNSLPSSTKL